MDLCFDPWFDQLGSSRCIKHPVETWKVAYLVKPGARFSCVQVCKVCKALVFDITSNMVQGVIQHHPHHAVGLAVLEDVLTLRFEIVLHELILT